MNTKKKRSPNRGPYIRLDAERFVRIWQGSKSVADAAKKYGWPKSLQNFCNQAANFRRRGVPLKKFYGGGGRKPAHDIQALARIAREAGK